MAEITVGGWRLNVDVERTRDTYRRIGVGGWERCGCSHCRNFGAVVESSLPIEVARFFSEAGIDPKIDAEVYELGPSGDSARKYGGEYYFWGEVLHDPKVVAEEGAPFQFTFTEPSPLHQEQFSGGGALCFYFVGDMPWVLNESPDA